MKTCSHCKRNKPFSDFDKQKLGKNGYRSYCKKCSAIRSSDYYQKNRSRCIENILAYNKLPKAKAYRRLPHVKFIQNIRRRVREANLKSERKLIHDFGCSYQLLRHHIERQFSSEMYWNNYGSVSEIDHIRPVCYFTNEAPDLELNLVNHYENLRPLLKKDNALKAKLLDQRFWKK